MQNLFTRLIKLESAARVPKHPRVRSFAIEGPKDLPEGASVAFLRSCGYDVRDEDLNIVRVFVAADRDLPLRDVTRACGR